MSEEVVKAGREPLSAERFDRIVIGLVRVVFGFPVVCLFVLLPLDPRLLLRPWELVYLLPFVAPLAVVPFALGEAALIRWPGRPWHAATLAAGLLGAAVIVNMLFSRFEPLLGILLLPATGLAAYRMAWRRSDVVTALLGGASVAFLVALLVALEDIGVVLAFSAVPLVFAWGWIHQLMRPGGR